MASIGLSSKQRIIITNFCKELRSLKENDSVILSSKGIIQLKCVKKKERIKN